MMKHISELSLDDFDRHEAWSWIEVDRTESDGMVAPVDPGDDPLKNCAAIFCKCHVLFHDETQLAGKAGIRCSDRFIYFVTIYRRGREHIMSLHPQLLDHDEVEKTCRFLDKTPYQMFPLKVAVKIPSLDIDEEQTFELPLT